MNEKATSEDPSLYGGNPNGYDPNDLLNGLKIRFVESSSSQIIFYATVDEDHPVIILNRRGWEQFLNILLCLRDESSWFYVVPKNPEYNGPLRFELSSPLDRSSREETFWALECIRLEPEETIELSTCVSGKDVQRGLDLDEKFHYEKDGSIGMEHTIHGSVAGLLLLSGWLRDFVMDPANSKDILNEWDPRIIPFKVKESWIHLEKIYSESNFPITSMQVKNDGRGVLAIFANQAGFIELADIFEEYAFKNDIDHLLATSPNRLYPGDLTSGVKGENGYYAITGWYLRGGTAHSPHYNPFKFRTGPDFQNKFINQRVLR